MAGVWLVQCTWILTFRKHSLFCSCQMLNARSTDQRYLCWPFDQQPNPPGDCCFDSILHETDNTQDKAYCGEVAGFTDYWEKNWKNRRAKCTKHIGPIMHFRSCWSAGKEHFLPRGKYLSSGLTVLAGAQSAKTMFFLMNKQHIIL